MIRYLVLFFVISNSTLFADLREVFLGDQEVEFYMDGVPKPIVIEKNNPASGYYYVGTHDIQGDYLFDFPNTDPIVMVFDNYGTAVYFDKPIENPRPRDFISEFKFLNDSIIVFHNLNDGTFWLHDQNMLFLRKVRMDYFFTDMHGIQMDEEGNFYMMSYPYISMDISDVYEDVDEQALVFGAHVQILGPDNKPIFNWSSFDHLGIDEIPDYMVPKLVQNPEYFDYCHINTIDIVSDTSILISLRNMNDLIWIDTEDGSILHRMGLSKKNEFEFTSKVDGEIPEFYQQHDSRMIDDTTLTVLDNGTFGPNDYSRVCIYDVDFENKIAELVKVYRNKPDIFGQIMANAQTLENDNIVTGWGSGTPGITEFHADGSIESMIWIEGASYRAYKFDKMPTCLTSDKEQLDFIRDGENDILSNGIIVKNNYHQDLTINQIELNTQNFTLDTELPIEIKQGEEFRFTFSFQGKKIGEYEDIATLSANFGNKRIATQVKLNAQSKVVSVNSKNEIQAIYPNPVQDIINLKFNNNFTQDIKIEIYSIRGDLVFQEHLGIQSAGLKSKLINTSNLPSGFYLLVIEGEISKEEFKFIKQ